eukprot:CAMPEP_0172636274 /NCGR_PEP_ID=MMETSP1068-20121228/203129_1 /TAXON_ID=35684 /ORGANISM="Pseudopedinella elastica, Strain CCMP716" /LENGTH=104 /DNA_ID=CAMNT_0013448655 /DNA_START=20 /DNA_END=331 /DNA_ORIENTATION=+
MASHQGPQRSPTGTPTAAWGRDRHGVLLASVSAALLAVVLHLNTLGNALVWDDRAAVQYNGDVRGTTPLRALLTNDFWGQAMALPDSHKSYRPLAVLSLRLNHA